MLQAEKHSKYYPVLNALRWSDAKSIFLEQINGYFRGIPPYNVYNGVIPLIWWQGRKSDPKWFLIAVSWHDNSRGLQYINLSIISASAVNCSPLC